MLCSFLEHITHFARKEGYTRTTHNPYFVHLHHPGRATPFPLVGSLGILMPTWLGKICTNKLHTKDFLAMRDIKTAQSISLLHFDHPLWSEKYQETLEQFITQTGFPLVCKPVKGSQGKNIHKLTCKNEISTHQTSLSHSSPLMMLEKYISGSEYRILSMDGEIVVVYQKVGENWPKNLHFGTKMVQKNLTDTEQVWAKKLVGLFPHGVVGIDIISPSTLDQGYVLEVNGSPGTKGIVLLPTKQQTAFRQKVWQKIHNMIQD